MRPSVPPKFRPSIIIYVGTTGDTTAGTGAATAGITRGIAKSVYHYFHELCASLDAVLYSGVGILTVADGSEDATLHLLRENETAPREGNFRILLGDLLRQVQGDRLKSSIERAGYAVPQPYPQIYIVGHTHADWVSEVARWTNDVLETNRHLSFIAYMLIDFPRYTGSPLTQFSGPPTISAISNIYPPLNWIPPAWTRDLLPDGDLLPRVNFCFMYEEANQDRTYVEEADIHYAVAQALFALVATGISTTVTFREATGISIITTDLDTRIGSLGTSLIHFPRDAAEQYCSNIHGAAIIRSRIHSTQKPEHTEQAQSKIREQAQLNAEQINTDLSDQNVRPGVPEHHWPGLSFLENDVQQELQNKTETLFSLFRARKDWEVLPKRREAQAFQSFRGWRLNALPRAWKEAEQVINKRIEQIIDSVLQRDDSGELVKIYLDQFDTVLQQALDGFMKLREEHKAYYDEEIDKLQRLSVGPWVIAEDAPVIIDQATSVSQATPTLASISASTNQPTRPMGPPLSLSNSGITAERTTLQAPPVVSTQDFDDQSDAGQERLPQKLLRDLEKRAEWMKNHIPTITGLIGVGIVTTPPLVLLILSLLPLSWFMYKNVVLLVILSVAFVIAMACWLFRLRAQWRADAAERAFLDVYRFSFAYRCEQQEDQWRAIITWPLLRKVRKIRQRLENMENVIDYLAKQLERNASQTIDELFASPAAFRDVFIADGELLTKSGYTLESLNQRINHLRQIDPREKWHQSNGQINEHMNAYLAMHKITFLSPNDEQELLKEVQEFCRIIISLYLHGDLIDIGKALYTDSRKNSVIWQQVQKRAKILYLPRNEAPELFFICGREEHCNAILEKTLPPNTTIVRTLPYEWLTVVRFWTGGTGTRWSSNTNPGIGPFIDALLPKPDWSQ